MKLALIQMLNVAG